MNKIALLTISIIVATLTGCASPARVDQMTAQSSPAQRISKTVYSSNVAVREVSGGKETNPMWVSNVGNLEFEKALEASLANAGMLAGGKQLGSFVLVAHMEKVEQPMMGFDMTVTATVNYVLTERSTGKDVFSKRFAVPFTATVSDAFVGTERLRLANEGAIRANISSFIDELAKVGASQVALQ